MSRLFRCFVAILCVAPTGLAHGPVDAGEKPAQDQRSDAFFGLTKVHAMHLELSMDAWKKMQPSATGFAGPFGPKKPAPPPDKEKGQPGPEPADIHKSAGAFGIEFTWVRGQFIASGMTFPSVGVRYKGNFTYMASAHMLRRSFKIDLDHYGANQKLAGHKKINLSSGVTDPERIREALAFAVYRAAGVPAPRTAYAELTLTVPGKYDKELVGLYTVIEQVDKPFLTAHFKSSKGLLLKPENLRGGLQYLGEEWPRYQQFYRPKDEATKTQKARLIAFARLVDKSDDATFRKEIASYLDVDAFIRFVAADAVLANLDSFLGFGHNFYLYLRADTNQFVFMPWDLDLALGMWPVGGPPAQQMNLSVEHPHVGKNNLIDRLFVIKEVKEKYLSAVKELSATCFTRDKLLADIDAIEKAIEAPLERERKAAAARNEPAKGMFAGIVGQAPPLRIFVEKRIESVLAQLAGERKGYVPAGMGLGVGQPGFGQPGFGQPGGMKPPPGGFGPGGFLAKPLLATLDLKADGKVTKDEIEAGIKRFFRLSTSDDKDDKASIDEAALAAGINRIVPRPPGFPEPPKGFGLGNLLSGSIAKRADANRDDRITQDELVAAAMRYFAELDEGKRGHLDQDAIAAGINRLLPSPRPGFVPPGFGQPKAPPRD